MPALNFYDPCPAPVVLDLPENNFQAECNCNGGGGGSFTLFTSDTGSIQLSGDGTNGDPLSANLVNDQNIIFEMAFGAQGGFAFIGQQVGIYVPTKDVEIQANLPGLSVAVEGQNTDIEVDITKNDVVVGHISIVGGVADVDFASTVNLVPGDKLELVTTAVAEFSVLGITIQALRTLEFVA